MNGFMSLIAIALDWSSAALVLALYAGVWAGLLAAVVLAVNVLCRRWLSSRQMGLMWGIVMLRLVVPVAPSSSLSLQNLMPAGWRETVHYETESGDFILPTAVDSSAVTDSQPLDITIGAPDSGPRIGACISRLPTGLEAAEFAIEDSLGGEPLITTLVLVWLIGGAASLLGTTFVYWKLSRRLKCVSVSDDPRLLGLWQACCEQVGVRRRIPIVPFDGVEQPAVLGLFRPRLLLPPDSAELSDDQLRMIMLHELAHVRHGDIAANWVLLLIRAIHWWNPIFWLAAGRFQALREQACDAFAIERLGGRPMREYSELLLKLAGRAPSKAAWRVMLPASILGFFSSFFRQRAVANRLRALRSAGRTRSRWQAVLFAALIGLIAIGGLTDASTLETVSDEPTDVSQSEGFTWAVTTSRNRPPMDQGPIVACTYDIDKALRRISLDETTPEQAEEQLKWHLLHLLAGLEGRRFDPTLADDRKWAEDRLTRDGTTVIVNAPRCLHAEICRNLEAWEEGGLAQMTVAARFIMAERDLAATVGATWRSLEAFSDDGEEILLAEPNAGMPAVRAKAVAGGYLPVAVAILDDRQAVAFLEAGRREREKGAEFVDGPKVTVVNGERVSLSGSAARQFAVGADDSGAAGRQSKSAVIEEDIRLVWRAVQRRDPAKFQFEGRVELSQTDLVGAVTAEPRGEPATIRAQHVLCRIDVRSELQDRETLVVGCFPTRERKQYFYVVVTVRKIAPAAE